jgi:hypothetical protein
MRLEQIEKEADLYRGKGECYIHIERANDSPISCIMAGDSAALMQATFNVICHLSEQMNKPFNDVLKLFKRAYKQFGIPEHKVVVDE